MCLVHRRAIVSPCAFVHAAALSCHLCSGRGQYKGGSEGDENEEFMEMQDGGLMVTLRVGSGSPNKSKKQADGASQEDDAVSESLVQDEAVCVSPGRDGDSQGRGRETASEGPEVAKIRAVMQIIAATHPHTLRAWLKQEERDTDGRCARIQMIISLAPAPMMPVLEIMEQYASDADKGCALPCLAVPRGRGRVGGRRGGHVNEVMKSLKVYFHLVALVTVQA